MEQEITTSSDINVPQSDKQGLDGLLEGAHEALEKFDSDTARQLLTEAVTKYPDNERALFELGYFLYEEGDIASAEVLLKQSIQLEPEKNAKKYFTLAQILTEPSEIDELYTKGLQIVLAKVQALKQQQTITENYEEKMQKLKRQASQGFCGLAQLEVVMAGPNFESFNGHRFLEFIKQALEIDSSYLEAYSQLALYYFNIQDEMSCRKTLAELVAKVKEMEDQGNDDLGDYGPQFFVPIVRMMIEGEIWDDGIYLMEIGLQSNGKDLEGNYMYAFCLFKGEEYDQAREVCQEMEKMGILKSGDEELIQGYVELKQEIETAIHSLPADEQRVKTPDSENDWMDDN
jgi:tetratricopeptide (TPR) repeat protein